MPHVILRSSRRGAHRMLTLLRDVQPDQGQAAIGMQCYGALQTLAGQWTIKPLAFVRGGSSFSLCRVWKSWELPNIAGIMLDDHRRLCVRCNSLYAIDGGDGLRAIGVEDRHSVVLIVLMKMREISA